MKTETVRLNEDNNTVIIIDQTRLPCTVEYLSLKTIDEVWHAIKTLAVRGAPAIGVCAALGLYTEACRLRSSIDKDALITALYSASEYLKTSRPTAVNLFWALEEMEKVIAEHSAEDADGLISHLRETALGIYQADLDACKAIGEHGLPLIENCSGILTHCNAGALAAVDYGTALAPIYLAYEKGLKPRVFADETRPLLQGARLTAFELQRRGVDVTLLCDNMAAYAMKSGWIQAVLVGCDRVAMNGDFANKIGTCGVAVLAKHFGIPFYVCAPTSTIDPHCADGSKINIENRSGCEVTHMWYKAPMAPDGISVLNPAFDVTDSELVSAFITERGVVYPPYDKSLQSIIDSKQNKCNV